MTRNVLIIENDFEASRAAAKAVEAGGYLAFTASSAEVGLMMARRVKPSLVILNIAVKGAGGFDFIAKLRESEGLRNVPILLFSEGEREYDAGYLEKYGVVNFIKKPVDEIEIIQKSKAALEDIPAHGGIAGRKEEVSPPEAEEPAHAEPYVSPSYRETFERLAKEEMPLHTDDQTDEPKPAAERPLRLRQKRKLSKSSVFWGVLLVFFGAMASFGYFMLFLPARKAELAVSVLSDMPEPAALNSAADLSNTLSVSNATAIINSSTISNTLQPEAQKHEALHEEIEEKSLSIKEKEKSSKEAPKAVPKEAENAKKTAGKAHFHAVQVGVFGTRANAERLLAELKADGFHQAVVMKTEKGFRVLVGRFETPEQAEPLLKKLKARGFQALRYSE